MTSLFAWMEELEQKKIQDPTDHRYRIQWKKNEPMSRHTTFRIGGSAALYAVCETVESLAFLILACRVTVSVISSWATEAMFFFLTMDLKASSFP